MHRQFFRTAILLLILALALGAMPVSADSTAPVAENLELKTYKGVSVGGRLSAVDADGGELIFSVVTEPTKGVLRLSPDGRFIYTPNEGKRGRDYFGYKATDAEGNESQEATVVIRIVRMEADLRYSDTTGQACDYAAHVLAAEDIFIGQQLGGKFMFEPARAVTRGEFLSMCMRTAGVEPLSGVLATGYLDDADIPLWQKPYVSTALLEGFASGYPTEGGAQFRAGEGITLREAAVMLDNVLGLTDVTLLPDAQEAPYAQAVANLDACHIVGSDPLPLDEPVSRGDAAMMLQRALEVLARR